MIYLITGLPGTGKTLHMVSMLAKRKDLKGRPLYVDGITDLDSAKIPHEALPDGCHGGNWHEWLPTGAILVIDECQRYWRPRANGSAVPDAVKAMETHRHRGVDIFLLTQHPRLLDINVRSFIENHKHLSKSSVGIRRMWEWQKCGSPDNKGDVRDALVSTYKLDKSVYNYYKSAEVHTKVKTRKSLWLYLLPVIALVTIGLSIWAAMTISGIGQSDTQQNATAPATSETDQVDPGRAQQNANTDPTASTVNPKTADMIQPEDYIPLMDGKPWTAPAYKAHNQNIQHMPYPVGCVKSGDRCTCYTDQATPIRGMDTGLCLDMVQNGIYNPYRPAKQTADGQQTPAAAAPTHTSMTATAAVVSLDSQAKPDLMPGAFTSVQ